MNSLPYSYPPRSVVSTCKLSRTTGGSLISYLRLTVLLQPRDDARRESVKACDADAGVEGLEQLVSDPLELQTG